MRPPALTHASAAIFLGDCLDVLAEMPDNSVDSIVTDPPYALPGGFMGKSWDSFDGREDAAFAYWLAGLIDGEGHFAIKAHTRGTHAPAFTLKMRADERGTLESIQRHLRIGAINAEASEPNPMVKWVVQDKEGCQRLVDLLDKYPLRAKKRMDFAIWREAVCEWTARPRGNRWTGPADNTRMAALRGRLMNGRRYVDPPWSGHEFQDWCRLWTTECLRVLKPGGHLLAFGGSRTWHRLACAIEDAGFEMRDSIAWLYGSGFPKSMDVSKAIDKRGGNPGLAAAIKAARESRGWTTGQADRHFCNGSTNWTWYEGRKAGIRPPTPADFARIVAEWSELAPWAEKVAEAEREVIGQSAHKSGIGNAAAGHYTVGGTVAEHVDITAPATPAAQQWSGWGTALKPAFEPIVVARKPLSGTVAANVLEHGTGALNIEACRVGGDAGRWPTNVALDGDAADELDEQSGTLKSGVHAAHHKRNAAGGNGTTHGDMAGVIGQSYADAGGASRFFPVFRYQAKAPTRERPVVTRDDGTKTAHPTVKPLALMRWLVRLVTPAGGTVLDTFAGSGATIEAAVQEGFYAMGIEREEDYLQLIQIRLDRVTTTEETP